MARDYALLEAFQRGEIPPTLRVYQWASPALTYGVNQQLPPRLIDACQSLGIPMFRRPTGGKAVLHGHDLTVALVFGYESALTPLSPLSRAAGEGGIDAPLPPCGRGAGGEGNIPRLYPQDTRIGHNGRVLGEGNIPRLYPRQVYQRLAPALVEAFRMVGAPAAQGDAPAPDPRGMDDGGDCFATPAIADIVHAETGVKLMGCALLVRGAHVLMQASIPLRLPDVPVERLFGHPHPPPPPLDADALTDALYRTLTRLMHTPASAINTAP